jgi:hypothetical protein
MPGIDGLEAAQRLRLQFSRAITRAAPPNTRLQRRILVYEETPDMLGVAGYA